MISLNQHEKHHRCSLCHDLALSRKKAMQHIRLEHTDEIIKPELNIGPIVSDSKCDKCKLRMSCKLIDLPCSRNLCLNCLPSTIVCHEIELPDQNSDFIYELACHLCYKPHQLDIKIALLTYELKERPHPLKPPNWSWVLWEQKEKWRLPNPCYKWFHTNTY